MAGVIVFAASIAFILNSDFKKYIVNLIPDLESIQISEVK